MQQGSLLKVEFRNWQFLLFSYFEINAPLKHFFQGTASERMDPKKIAVDLSASAKAKIVSTRIRVARNLGIFHLSELKS